MKIQIICFLIILLFSNVSSSREDKSNIWNKTSIVSGDCIDVIGMQSNDTDHKSECGYLVVPENYDKKGSVLIEIPYLIVYPEYPDRSKSPLIVTGGGGPGNAILKNSTKYQFRLSDYEEYFAMSVEEDRHLIILENRGVGHSKQSLACSKLAEPQAELYKLNIQSSMEKYSDYVDSCLENIKADGIDVTQYHAKNAALDIEALRILLVNQGISKSSQVNLYSISYGTRVALYYEMLFPDNTKSMILDSAVSHTKYPKTQNILNAQLSFDNLFKRCVTDSICRDVYGVDLEKDFYEFTDKLQNEPIQIDVINPVTLKSEKYTLDANTFLEILNSNMYSSFDMMHLPYLLRTVVNGSLQELSILYTELLAERISSTLDDVAYFSYLCFDNSYEDESIAIFENNPELYPIYKFYDESSFPYSFIHFCKKLQMKSDDQSATATHRITSPVLLLSGKEDTITPLSEAENIHHRAENSWMIEWDNVAHGVLGHSYCAQRISAIFLDAPSFDPTDEIDRCYTPYPELFYFVH